MMDEKLIEIINTIREGNNESGVESISEETKLREDIGFDSLDLAEFTVRVEKEYGVDIFEDGLVNSIREVKEKISNGSK